MDIENALKLSVEYETRVRDVYVEALKRVGDAKGKAIFQVLADEEQGHVDFLEALLKEWRETGAIHPADIETRIPPRDRIEAGVRKIEAGMADLDPDNDLQMLSKALDLEIETSRFYKKMVHEVPAEGRAMFTRFITVEEGHVAIVKAEMDHLIRTGYWFDFMEIDLNGV
ncbi:MAG: ferritin family protein [Acidobacteria bacterium]|nr:ferritin family protein [Acidobacteriota bacterium]